MKNITFLWLFGMAIPIYQTVTDRNANHSFPPFTQVSVMFQSPILTLFIICLMSRRLTELWNNFETMPFSIVQSTMAHLLFSASFLSNKSLISVFIYFEMEAVRAGNQFWPRALLEATVVIHICQMLRKSCLWNACFYYVIYSNKWRMQSSSTMSITWVAHQGSKKDYWLHKWKAGLLM